MKIRHGLQAELEYLERTDPNVGASVRKYNAAVTKILAAPIVALSLSQPWAWMVVYGGKGIENRRWNTRRRGMFLVHAAKGMTRTGYDDAVRFAEHVDPELVVPAFGDLDRGGIVGRASIVDVVKPCPTEPCAHRWHMQGQYGFVLADVAAVPYCPMKGALGFFKVKA